MGDEIVQPRTGEPDPVIEAYKPAIDRTLIRDSLKMTADERVRGLVALHEFTEELRRAMKTAKVAK